MNVASVHAIPFANTSNLSNTMADANPPTEDLFGPSEQEAEAPKEAITQDEVDEGEASLDTDMKAPEDDNITAPPQGMNLDGASDMPVDDDMPALETRLPAKKDVALREFLSKMDDYAPIVRFTFYAL